LLRPAQVDGAHSQAAVDAQKGGDRAVNTGELHAHQAVEQRASTCVGQTCDSQLAQLRQDFKWELRMHPVAIDDRSDALFHEAAHTLQEGLVGFTERGFDCVEVTRPLHAYFCRISFLSSLPTLVLSSASTNTTRLGTAHCEITPRMAN